VVCRSSTRSPIGGTTIPTGAGPPCGSSWFTAASAWVSFWSWFPRVLTCLRGSEDFRISVRDENGASTVIVEGEVDVATAPALREELYRLIDRGTKRIVVDLGGMDFIDSTGLGVFVGALKRSREGGGELELRSLKPAARKIFDITGLSSAFAIAG
jgi:anti-sigma B factor antagonist